MTRTQFDRYFLINRASLARLARYLCRNDSDAEDLVQETYILALESFVDLRQEQFIRTWLRRILHNAFYAQRRNREYARMNRCGFKLSVLENDAPDYRYTPTFTLVSRERHKKIQAVLSHLAPENRRPLLLHELQNHSYQDIASKENIPVGTVRSRISRGRRQARTSFQEQQFFYGSAEGIFTERGAQPGNINVR